MSRYNYACSTCGGSVTKTPTGTNNPKSKTAAGLHGWRCPKDGPTRVVRSLRKEQE